MLWSFSNLPCGNWSLSGNKVASRLYEYRVLIEFFCRTVVGTPLVIIAIAAKKGTREMLLREIVSNQVVVVVLHYVIAIP